ncbi:hypothetical protein Zmor_009555 [Zophobas morio]|uniref:Chitin-binding type-2 domain-containing protein n=1 Tax=Zophobas morio TaxID=2755281 RepID=A0AA38MIX7_9CUCU|nr:hypothetical protein Zmor_009555 [Zophobas morio]
MKFLLVLLAYLAIIRMSLATNCVAVGSFRQSKDPTCQKYFTCNVILDIYFIKTDLSCGTFMKFNPTTQQCDYTSVCIDSFCDNQPPLQKLPDPNALNQTCRHTYIQCKGITNQYPTIEQCPLASGCC